MVSDRELEDRPYQPLRATGHGDANGLMSASEARSLGSSYARSSRRAPVMSGH